MTFTMEALSLLNIGLYESTAIRYDNVDAGETMTLDMSIQNEPGKLQQDGTIECQSVCSLTIKNGEADFALFISQYRAHFANPQEITEQDLASDTPLHNEINEWLLSYIYPHHRQLVTDMNSRMGLPPIPLPWTIAQLQPTEAAR